MSTQSQGNGNSEIIVPEYYNTYPINSIVSGGSTYLNNLRPVQIPIRTNVSGTSTSFNSYSLNPSNLSNMPSFGNNNAHNYSRETKSVLEYGSSFPSDPVTTGPGLWYLIHLTAHDANTPQRIKEYIPFLRKIVAKHPCGVCRHHGSKYLNMFPPEKHINTKRDGKLTGMFFHSWMFHNTVNDRLDKKIMPYQTDWDIFDSLDEKVCQKDCGGSTSSGSRDLNDRVPIQRVNGDEFKATRSQYQTTPGQVNLSTYGTTISLIPRPKFGPVIRKDGYPQPVVYWNN